MDNVIARKTFTGSGGSITLLSRRLLDHGKMVRRLTVVADLDVANADGLNIETLAAATFGHNCTVDLKDAARKPILVAVPWRQLEYRAQVATHGRWTGHLEVVDKTVAAGKTEPERFYIDIPLADLWAERPEDFAMALSMLGQLTVRIGATGNADLSIVGGTLALVAEYEQKSAMYIGARKQVQSIPSDASVAEEIPLSEGLLHSIGLYSQNAASPTTTADGPQVAVDVGNTILDFQDYGVEEIQAMAGPKLPGAFPARSAMTDTVAAPIVTPGYRFNISDRPRGGVVNVKFSAQSATKGHQFYVLETIEPHSVACLRSVVPGKPSDAKLFAAVGQPTLDGSTDLPETLAPYLPIRYTGPGVRADACGTFDAGE